MPFPPIAANSASDDRLVAKPEVRSRTTFSDTTLWRRVKDGTFPAPVRISENRVAWRERDLAEWIASRAAGR